MIARLILGGLLLAMAVGQLASEDAFALALRGYGLAGESVLAYAVPAVELAAGLAVLTRRRAGGILALGVAAFWTALASQAFARGVELDNCGCFGRYLAQELRWWVLIEDVEFVLLAAWVAFRQRAGGSQSGAPGKKSTQANQKIGVEGRRVRRPPSRRKASAVRDRAS